MDFLPQDREPALKDSNSRTMLMRPKGMRILLSFLAIKPPRYLEENALQPHPSETVTSATNRILGCTNYKSLGFSVKLSAHLEMYSTINTINIFGKDIRR